jgi:hypothetical protein
MAGRNAQTRYTYSIPLASASLPSSAAPSLALAAFHRTETLTGGYPPEAVRAIFLRRQPRLPVRAGRRLA